MKYLLQILLLIPIATAIAAAALGGRRTAAVRWISLAASLACAVMALVLAFDLAGTRASAPALTGGTAQGKSIPTFKPQYETREHMLTLGPGEIQFYIGLDGLNV